jgi:flagellin
MSVNLQNNVIFNSTFNSFSKTFSKLQQSAERLASGVKAPNAAMGSGSNAVADRLKVKIDGTKTFVSAMQNAKGYLDSQEATLNSSKSLISRMQELAYAATDPLKSTSDRSVLNQEFRALEDEIRSYDSLKYNGISVFDTGSITVKLGIETADTAVIATLDYASLTFAAMSVDSAANAATAVTTLSTRAVSLNAMLATVGGNSRLIQNNIDLSKTLSSSYKNAESSIRNIDIAQEVAEFTSAQLVSNAAQGIISQTFGIHSQMAQRLLGF